MASSGSNFIILTAVLPFAIPSQKICTNLSNVPGFKNGYTLDTGVMHMQKLEGIFQCFYFCKAMTSCMSFSYDVIMGECHMFDMIGSADTLLKKENHVFANVMPSELKNNSTTQSHENKWKSTGNVISETKADGKKMSNVRRHTKQKNGRNRTDAIAGQTKVLPNNQTFRKLKNKTKTADQSAFPVENVVRSVKEAAKHSDSTKSNNQREFHPQQHNQVRKTSYGQASSEMTENAKKETVTLKVSPAMVAAEDPPDTNERIAIAGNSKPKASVKRNIEKKKVNKVMKKKKMKFTWGSIGEEIIENAKKTG